VEIVSMRKGFLVGCAFLGLGWLGCSDSPTGSGEQPGVIGPAGGAVSLGAEARIDVPAGALSEEILIQIVPVATPADLVAQGAIGQAYRFEPVGQDFATPARITILVPPAVLGGRSLDRVTILRSTFVTSALIPAGEELGSITRSSDGRVSGTTTQLGVFSAAISNTAPGADAGPDQNVVISATVNLSGSGTDPDGDTLIFSWAFVSRPAASAAALTNPGSQNATFVADVAGTYDVRLTVSDDLGGSNTDNVRIVATTAGGNSAPNAVAGPDLVGFVGATVALNGSGSADPDGDTLVFSWNLLIRPSGSAATITDAANAIASFVPDQPGVYDIRLTVSDGQLSDSDEVRVVVTQQNRAPTLNVSAPDAVFVGEEAVISAVASDPDNDAVTVDFELLEKPAGGGDLTAVGSTVRFTSNVAGLYRVRVIASDGRGGATQTDVVVGVNPHVDGDYGVTLNTDATSCGQGQDTRTGVLPVLQPSAGSVTLDLPGASSAFVDQAPGQLLGEEFSFSGTIRIQSGTSVFPFTGTIQGTIQASGELNLLFNFAAPANFCRVRGTIVGSRN
jgi:hypothetical protein